MPTICPPDIHATTKTSTSRIKALASATLCAAGLASALTITAPGSALAVNVPEQSVNHVTPHRAIYDLSLKNSLSAANISDANGRMVFEVSGSKCDGYLVNMRFILSVLDNKGVTNVTDVRSSSWEGGDAKRFRFNTSQYFNQKLAKTTVGNAEADDEGKSLSVKIDSPEKAKANFTEKTYFPTEHTIYVIEEALKGKKIVNAPIYDGSENGNTLYDTTAIIGKPMESDQSVEKSDIKNLDKLKGVASWPVSISFYDKKKSVKQDLLPDYEISFRLYANGVSRSLLVDYGDFALDGELTKIDFLPDTNEDCQ